MGLGAWPRNPSLGEKNGLAHSHGAAASLLIPTGPASCAESHHEYDEERLDSNTVLQSGFQVHICDICDAQ